MPNRFRNKGLSYVRLVLPALLVAASGCARLGVPLIYGPRPEGAPKPKELLAALAKNDRQIENFRVKGSCKLVTGEVGKKERLTAIIEYRRPNDAYVRVSKTVVLVTRHATARSVDGRFVFVDTEGNRTYGWPEGMVFASIPFASTPADMVREVFLPVEWDALKPRDLRFQTYDRDSGDLVLLLNQEKDFTRRLTLRGPPWVLVRSEMSDPNGFVFSSTTFDDYRDHDGIRFPGKVAVSLPGELVSLALDPKDIDLNADLDEQHFTIDEQDAP